jgi:SAM-dependent methyltransferase
VKQRVEDLLGEADVPLVELNVDPLVPVFRRNARSCLSTLARELRRVRALYQPPLRVAWLVANERNQGLDASEVEAVLGASVSVELLEQANVGSARSLTLAIGRVREEVIGLWASIPDGADPFGRAVARCLEDLERFVSPVAALAISRPTAEAWLACRSARAPAAARRLVEAGSALALRIPRTRTRVALADIQGEAAAVTQLAGGEPIRWIAFDFLAGLDFDGLPAILEDGRFAADASLRWASKRNERAPLTGSTSYVPHVFDLRSPSARPRTGQLIETIRVPLELAAPSPLQRLLGPGASARREWRGLPDARLPKLLDHWRVERYRTRMQSTELAQRYADYNVYNWPRADPPCRATLLDLGELGRPRSLRASLRQLARLASEGGPWRRVVPAATFLAVARQEALDRLSGSAPALLAQQHAAHTYLSTASLDEPLRADIERFAAALPEKLGRTLEIGSGRGQLARHLRSRSRLYVCCDASAALLRDAPRPGACADIHALPFASARFDTIVANNVLEHAYDPLVCLRELGRVLTADGALHAFIPLDGLDPRHEIRTHLWKADTLSIELAVRAAGLRLLDLEVVDIYALGVAGAFPTCQGKVGRFVAARSDTKGAA